jgi:hypothetical protein
MSAPTPIQQFEELLQEVRDASFACGDWHKDLARRSYNEVMNDAANAAQKLRAHVANFLSADRVAIPQNEEQASAMMAVAYSWLAANAPERLTKPPQAD